MAIAPPPPRETPERRTRPIPPQDPAEACHLTWQQGGIRFCGSAVGTSVTITEVASAPTTSPCIMNCGRPRCRTCARIYANGEA